MKIAIFSDLHAEKDEKCCSFKDINCDLIVLAGDIHKWNKSVEWIKRNFPKDKKVIYVAGNHEFYGTTIKRGVEFLKEEASKTDNIVFLEKEEFVINDTVFLGTTLWSDFNLMDNREFVLKNKLGRTNDFSSISHQNNSISYENFIAEFNIAVDFLKESLSRHRDKKTVIVTHFAPSIKAIFTGYLNSPSLQQRYSPTAFASNLEYLIKDNPQIKLWIYGHTHFSTQFKIGETMIISNQRGYPFDKDKNFRKDLIFQVQ